MELLTDAVSLEMRSAYRLLPSPGLQPDGRQAGGVAFLVSHAVGGGGDVRFQEHLPSPLASITDPVLSASNSPDVRVVVVYGSNIVRERKQIQTSLEPLLSGVSVILGDRNRVSVPGLDCTSEDTFFWHLLAAKETDGTVVDVAREHYTISGMDVPHTPVRGYQGITSYLDRVYLTRKAACLMPFADAEVLSVGRLDEEVGSVK